MNEYMFLSALVSGGVMLIVIFIVMGFIDRSIHGSKSYQYRKAMVDMYVVGKLKQLAKKNNIDLDEQFSDYLLSSTHKKDLDDEIEEEITDNISEDPKDSKPTQKE